MGQNPIYKLAVEQGLASNLVYAIVQDNNGFIWIATDRGLNRFDGRNLTLFAPNSGRYSVSHHRTQCLVLADGGNVWTGTSDGLNIYNVQTDSVIKVRDNTTPLKLKYNDITVLAQSADKSKIWMGTYGNGVHFYENSKSEFSVLSLPKIPNVPAPLNVVSLLEDDAQRLWIGTQDNGLYRFSLKEKSLVHYPMPESGNNIRAIFEDSHRRIWIGTSNGCYIYNETGNRLDLLLFPTFLADSSIGAIAEDKSGGIWIGSESALLTFSARSFSLTEKFEYALYQHGKSSSRLSCPSINAIFVDAENNIWVGTAWGGVNILKGVPSKFKLFKHDASVANSLPFSPINSVCALDDGHLIIGTLGADDVSLCKMALADGSTVELPVGNELNGYIYQAMQLDVDGRLWVGTYNKGLLVMDKDFSRYKKFVFNSQDANSLPNNDVRAIYEGNNQVVWVGTSNGLAKVDKTNLSHLAMQRFWRP
jgi:ligand-binding sensor domain-containing protein